MDLSNQATSVTLTCILPRTQERGNRMRDHEGDIRGFYHLSEKKVEVEEEP
jgi:hypothetical protein